MSLYPGVCVPAERARPATPTVRRARASRSRPPVVEPRAVSHYFTSVDLPLTPGFPDAFASDATLDASGVPVGLEAAPRRDAPPHVRALDGTSRARRRSSSNPHRDRERRRRSSRARRLQPGARDLGRARGARRARRRRLRVGHVDEPDEDLARQGLRARDDPDDVRDGKGARSASSAPTSSTVPTSRSGARRPRSAARRSAGKGLINFQNGFLRCVRCIGTIDERGRCQAGAGRGGRAPIASTTAPTTSTPASAART